MSRLMKRSDTSKISWNCWDSSRSTYLSKR